MTLPHVRWLALALALLAGRAAAQLCVPVLECRELLEREIEESPLGPEEQCQLADGSEGVRCFSPPLAASPADLFGGLVAALPPPPLLASPAPASPAGDIEPIVKPLSQRLSSPEQLLISSRVKLSEVVKDSRQKLAEAERTVQQLQASGQNVAPAGSAQSLQQLFAQPQSAEAAEAGRASLQSLEVLKNLRNLSAISDKPLSLAAEVLFLGVEAPPLEPPPGPPGPLGVEFPELFLPPPPPGPLGPLGVEFPELFLPPPPPGRPGAPGRPALPLRPPPGTDLLPGCQSQDKPNCDGTERFRRHNGECNNLARPRLGRAVTGVSRLFPNAFDDGVSSPRSRGIFGPLPSPRLASERVLDTSPSADRLRSLSVMPFGQFVTHDVVSTPTAQLPDGSGLACCHLNGSFPSKPLHLLCNPIRVPDDDPFFSQFKITCLNHVRSLTAPFEDCIAAPASPLNQLSHFLDASQVYGSNRKQADSLRTFSGGRLKTTADNMLPRARVGFLAGEGRNFENPGLVFLHVIWVREHNRVAAALAATHPDWDDERLYQEARRIVVAEYQHVVFAEYLPTVVGYRYTRQHGLDPKSFSPFSYNESVDPRITAEFSTAGFRFGHSQVQDAFILTSEVGRVMQTLAMEDTFFKTSLMERSDAMAPMARSLTRQKPRSVDSFASPAVHEKLFAGNKPFGLDLLALNINRGRDHGLPSYVTVLENCRGRPVLGDWDGLAKFFEPRVLERLRSVYDTIYDIDLYIGGLTEKPKLGALVGETFQCIVGEQFFALRHGDRFFYDNMGQPGSFTFPQLEEIKKTSWARVLCDNVESLKQVQPLAFRQPSTFANHLRPCNSFAIPSVDLSVF